MTFYINTVWITASSPPYYFIIALRGEIQSGIHKESEKNNKILITTQ